MLKAVCHLCGSIGPMTSVSRYLLWQCGNAISHTMSHVNRDPSKHETPKMFGRYWPEILDGGPTSTQHRINVSCLPGCQIQLEYHDKKLAILTCPRGSAMTRASKLLQYRCAGHSTATQTQVDISWQYVISPI